MTQPIANCSEVAKTACVAAAEQVLDNVRQKHLTTTEIWDALGPGKRKMDALSPPPLPGAQGVLNGEPSAGWWMTFPLISRDGDPVRASGAAQRQFLHRQGPAFASNDADPDELATANEGDCRFEIFRTDKERTTSTRFSGDDWNWRLVTTEGVLMAEAAGYPSEGLCCAAVLVLQRCAATALVARVGEPT